jgi:hypothetical protein
VCIKEIGRDYLMGHVHVEENIVIGAFGNGVLKTLLGFMEKNY